LSFRAIDALTGEPLDSVTAHQVSRKHDYVLASREKQRVLQASGADGLIVSGGLETTMSHSFAFSKAGYLSANATIAAQASDVGVFREGGRGGEPDLFFRRNRTIEIPLTPEK
jgi:hypothetical protein